ncbi:MAG: transposase [bacterium]
MFIPREYNKSCVKILGVVYNKINEKETLNRIMKSEREIYLSSNDDYANGYIERGLGTPLGKLSLSSPRTQTGEFRSQVLPDRYKRDIGGKREGGF